MTGNLAPYFRLRLLDSPRQISVAHNPQLPQAKEGVPHQFSCRFSWLELVPAIGLCTQTILRDDDMPENIYAVGARGHEFPVFQRQLPEKQGENAWNITFLPFGIIEHPIFIGPRSPTGLMK
jgi:hypothetical protein